MKQEYTIHAQQRMQERGVSESQVQSVIDNPQSTERDETGKVILSGTIELHGKTMALRVVTFTHEELGVKTLIIISVNPAKLGSYGTR